VIGNLAVLRNAGGGVVSVTLDPDAMVALLTGDVDVFMAVGVALVATDPSVTPDHATFARVARQLLGDRLTSATVATNLGISERHVPRRAERAGIDVESRRRGRVLRWRYDDLQRMRRAEP